MLCKFMKHLLHTVLLLVCIVLMPVSMAAEEKHFDPGGLSLSHIVSPPIPYDLLWEWIVEGEELRPKSEKSLLSWYLRWSRDQFMWPK